MKYKLIIFDVDGTITRHISSWRLIHEKLGLWDALARKYQDEFSSGRINYKKFCELDAAHWKGIREKKIRGIFKAVQYSKNVKKVIGKFKNMNFKLAAVSTGLQFITDRIKEELKFDYVLGNRLNTRGGILTGGVKINISHGAKGNVVRKISKKFNIKNSEIIAVGDTDGDIPMFRMAGYSIAFNSSSKKLSRASDYECASRDFMEIYKKVRELNTARE